jgi:hypothetical protein
VGDRPDITIPEEAIERGAVLISNYMYRTESEEEQARLRCTADAALRGGAPLIVAAALSEMADQLDVRGVDDASGHLRARAAEFRGGAQ